MANPRGPVARDLRRWLAAVAAVALALRLVALDRRAVHFDEARVGVEMLAYLQTGEWLYYPALHGPFLFHVDRTLFGLLGPSDAVLRLPVAVIGGLLPLVAWLYRDHLADAEVVALGVVLAANPLLLYYGRFARNDLPVAAFMVVTLGCWLRLRATGRPRYLYAATAALALGLASKENALLYLLSWLGAALVLALARPDPRSRFGWRAVRDRLRGSRTWLGHTGAATLGLVALLTLLYAPRGGDGTRLGRLLSPDGLAVVGAGTVEPARRLLAVWVYGEGHPVEVYATFLGRFVALLIVTSLPLVAFAAVGAVVEWRRAAGRYQSSGERGLVGGLRRLLTQPRYLMAFSLLWAGAGVVGYPLASDLVAAWTVVHVVVPLAIPAAVGLAAAVSLARSAADGRTRRLATVGLVLAAVFVGGLAGWSSYAAPGAPYNPFGQPGQAEGDLRSTMQTVEAVSGTSAGPDVAYVGDFYATYLWRVPYEWYLAPAGVASTARSPPLDDPPPVVVALDVHAETLGPSLAGYVCVEHDPYPWGRFKPGGRGTETVVYVDRTALDGVGPRWRDAAACGPGPEADDRPLLAWLERRS